MTRILTAASITLASLTSAASAHVGNHAVEGISHVLTEHGLLLGLAAAAVGAFLWAAIRNRTNGV